MAAIFQTTFSNACSWMKMHEFRLRFHWNLFRRSNQQNSSIGLDNGLAPVRRQAIIWTNDVWGVIFWQPYGSYVFTYLGVELYGKYIVLKSFQFCQFLSWDLFYNVSRENFRNKEQIHPETENNNSIRQMILIHWGRVTHICVIELTIIGSDNGLSPGRPQAIIWHNARLLLIEPLGTNFSEISIGIQRFSFTKMHLNMSFAKWRPFCLGLNVLMRRKITPNGNVIWRTQTLFVQSHIW